MNVKVMLQRNMFLLVLVFLSPCSGEPGHGQGVEGVEEVKQGFHDNEPWIPSPSKPVPLSRFLLSRGEDKTFLQPINLRHFDQS